MKCRGGKSKRKIERFVPRLGRTLSNARVNRLCFCVNKIEQKPGCECDPKCEIVSLSFFARMQRGANGNWTRRPSIRAEWSSVLGLRLRSFGAARRSGTKRPPESTPSTPRRRNRNSVIFTGELSGRCDCIAHRNLSVRRSILDASLNPFSGRAVRDLCLTLTLAL